MSTNNTNNDSPSTGNKTDEISALSVPHPVTKDDEEDKYQHTQKDGARDSDNHLSGDDEEISEEDESEEEEEDSEEESDEDSDDSEVPDLSRSRVLQGTAAKAKADVSGAANDDAASEDNDDEEANNSYLQMRRAKINRNEAILKSLACTGMTKGMYELFIFGTYDVYFFYVCLFVLF